MSVPKLRFKDDDGRDFPEWEEKELGEIIELMQSGISRLLNDSDVGLPVLRSTNLIDGKLNISELKYWYTVDNQGVNLENYFLKEGDLLVNFINSLAQIGKVALYEDLLKRKTIFTTNIMRLSFKKNANYKFIFCFFQTTDYEKHIHAITKPAVNQASFTTKEFKTLKVPFPSLREQTKIANFLTAVDEKITQLTQKCDLLAQYKKAVMQQIFSQELRFKDDDGRDFPEWESKVIGDITDKVIAGGTPSTLKKDYWNGTIRWMNSGELNLKRVFEVENRITASGLDNSSTKLIPPRCVLIGLAGQGKTRGTVAMNMIELCTNQSIASIYPKPEIFNEEFLYQNLDFRYEELRGLSTGDGGRGGLNLQIIKSVNIHLPSIREQTKIANFLSVIDDKISNAQAQLAAVKQYKQGLLQQMFV